MSEQVLTITPARCCPSLQSCSFGWFLMWHSSFVSGLLRGCFGHCWKRPFYCFLLLRRKTLEGLVVVDHNHAPYCRRLRLRSILLQRLRCRRHPRLPVRERQPGALDGYCRVRQRRIGLHVRNRLPVQRRVLERSIRIFIRSIHLFSIQQQPIGIDTWKAEKNLTQQIITGLAAPRNDMWNIRCSCAEYLGQLAGGQTFAFHQTQQFLSHFRIFYKYKHFYFVKQASCTFVNFQQWTQLFTFVKWTLNVKNNSRMYIYVYFILLYLNYWYKGIFVIYYDKMSLMVLLYPIYASCIYILLYINCVNSWFYRCLLCKYNNLILWFQPLW